VAILAPVGSINGMHRMNYFQRCHGILLFIPYIENDNERNLKIDNKLFVDLFVYEPDDKKLHVTNNMSMYILKYTGI
jgi:hypothetical protein